MKTLSVGWEQHDVMGAGQRVRRRQEHAKGNQQVLSKAFALCQAKSLNQALQYLVAMKFVVETPREIAAFLRVHKQDFGEVAIGEFLGEGDGAFKVHLRLTFVHQISFVGLSLVGALRCVLLFG